MNLTTVIVKVTNDCNLRCKYCYLEKTVPKNMIISLEILDRLFTEIDRTVSGSEITITFHGGEPLLAGQSFFQQVLNIQKKHKKRYRNLIQTNGLLINPEYAEFFKNNSIHVGISLDGPQSINDLTRVDLNNNSTFKKIVEKIHILKKNQTPVGILSTITSCNYDKAQELYTFCKENDLLLKFNPLILSGSAKENVESLHITVDQYTLFLREMLDLWMNDQEPVNIDNFEGTIRSVFYTSHPPMSCRSCINCHESFIAIGPRGDLFPCGLFQGYEGCSYGNILDISLCEIVHSDMWKMMTARNAHITKVCGECPVYFMCHGGCPFTAYLWNKNLSNRDTYCEAYKFSSLRLIELISKRIRKEKNDQNRKKTCIE